MRDPHFQQSLRAVLREELQAVLGPLIAPKDLTQPITTEELCARWKVKAASKELQLHKLARLARLGRLKPLAGGKGWTKRYALTAVIAAEKVLQRKGGGV